MNAHFSQFAILPFQLAMCVCGASLPTNVSWDEKIKQDYYFETCSWGTGGEIGLLMFLMLMAGLLPLVARP